jgi:hypothetical protein
MFCGRYCVGDKVLVKIGDRPALAFTILECVDRDRPHYRFDWAEHGFNAILNTVAIPESSVLNPVL